MASLEHFYNIEGAILDTIDSSSRKMGVKQEYLSHGSDNLYDQHLLGYYKNIPVLRSMIEGSALLSADLMHSPIEIDWYQLYYNLFLYGTAYLFVQQSKDHTQYFLSVLDNRYVRTNKNKSSFIYSELPGFRQVSEYPAYSREHGAQSIIMINLNQLEAPYSLPIWSSALREVQILDQVASYHSASLLNNFSPSVLLNFNNGIPGTEDKQEIEHLVTRKFTGSENASKIMLSFNDDKEHAPTIEPISVEDRSQRYIDLIKHCESVLGQAFRGSPVLFGANDESAQALTETEFGWRMGLFVRFTIKPIVEKVKRSLAFFGVTNDDPMSLVDNTREVSEGE